ncbi:MAG: protein O-GlcNAcase, partial [Gemmatimonadales bacterium]
MTRGVHGAMLVSVMRLGAMRCPLVLVGALAFTGCESPAPPLQHAGVIEGFYGAPWSHDDRLDILRFMGNVGLDTYVYAPKDDPYHRERWSDPYPDEELARLRALVATAQEAAVEFWYAISPGGSMVYSDSAHYRALEGKIRTVSELGVTHFGFFVDDVPATLQHERDRESFRTLASAHAHVINRLYHDLAQHGARLAVTPTTYTDAWGDRDYLAELGDLVDPGVPFFWTGVDVASPAITREEADRWAEATGRKPIVWDNYPVNDYARWRPFLGPFRGRDPELSRSTAGLVSNPMNEAHASMMSLATLAAYARDPGAYRPLSAQRTALISLYGEKAAQLLGPLIEVYGDYGWDENLFEPLYILRDTIEPAPMEDALRRLGEAIEALRNATSTGSEPVEPVVDELAPFIERTTERLEQLLRDTSYVRTGDRLVYRADRDRYEASRPGSKRHVIDGDLSEWTSPWHDLGGGSRVSFAADRERTLLAVAVRDPLVSPRAAEQVGEGDHVQLILDVDPLDARFGLT